MLNQLKAFKKYIGCRHPVATTTPSGAARLGTPVRSRFRM